MRKIIFLLVIFILPAQLFAQEKGVQFDKTLSWSQIKATAQSENKYIFLDLYATWCGPCKLMEQNVYPNDTVANFFKDHFIPVKVQMDSTANDNAYVKSWYKDRSYLARQYKIAGYPTFLFFTPEGDLILQDIGYKDVKDFMGVLEQAVDPKRKLLYSTLNAYKVGNKNYDDMAGLALFTSSIVKDTALANHIARDYTTNYLDTVSSEKICTKENLDFAYQFYDFVHDNDRLFDLLYNEPQKVDQIKGSGWSGYMANFFITRDELQQALVKDKKPIYKNVDWKTYEIKIQTRYPKLDAHKIVFDFKIGYYRFYDIDWQKWTNLKEEQFKDAHYTKKDSIAIYEDLNSSAWDAFQNCNDKSVLWHAITWVDEAIKLDENYQLVPILDTKANLLYKLNHKQEALSIERRAMAMADPQSKKMIASNYEKMEKGLKTWPDK